MPSLIPTEFEEQCTFVDWLEMKGIKFTSVPNGTWTKSWSQKVKNRQSGLRKGFPDLIIIIDGSQCRLDRSVMLCIEMKRLKGTYPSPEQVEWIEALNTINDTAARVCKGAEEAIEYVQSMLK